MMDALQWAGFIGTLAGYVLLLHVSRMWGSVIGAVGVTALGLWAYFVDAWPVVFLEGAFVGINLHAICQELRKVH